MRSMPRTIPTGLVLAIAIGEKKSNQPERPGCRRRRPGGSVNDRDVPKAHELQLGSGPSMRVILMDLMGSRHRPLQGRRICGTWVRDPEVDTIIYQQL